MGTCDFRFLTIIVQIWRLCTAFICTSNWQASITSLIDVSVLLQTNEGERKKASLYKTSCLFKNNPRFLQLTKWTIKPLFSQYIISFFLFYSASLCFFYLISKQLTFALFKIFPFLSLLTSLIERFLCKKKTELFNIFR